MPDPSSPTPVEGYDDPPTPPLPGADDARPATAGAGAIEPVEVTAEPVSGDQATHAPPADDGAPRAAQDGTNPSPGGAAVQVEGPVEVDDAAPTIDPTHQTSGPSAPAEAGGDQPVDTTRVDTAPVDNTPVDNTGEVAPDRVADAPPPPPTAPTTETLPTTDSSDGGDDGSDETASDLELDEPSGRRNRKKVEIDLRFLLALLLVVALAAGAYAFGTYQGNKGRAAVDGANSTGTTVFKPPKEFVPLADPATGVKLSVPKDWVQYSTRDLPDKAIRLSVGIPNTGDTVVVRVNPYSTEITEANLSDQKNVFDQLFAEEKIQIFVNQPTKLAGLPALFYVYRFTDQATGKAGIHAHYFVFQGRKMVSLIFQALPETRYETLAPTFDTMANSLEVAPGPLPDFLQPTVQGSTPATTAAPGAPSAPAPPTTG